MTSLSSLRDLRVNGQVVDGAHPAPVADTAGKAVLDSILATLQLQSSLATTLWLDDSGAFYLRRDVIDEDSHTITVTFTDPTGTAATPGAGLRPAANEEALQTIQNEYRATATSGPGGYTTGDIIVRSVVLNQNASPPVVVAAFWLNLTTGAVIAAPTSGNLQEVISALPVGAATSARQDVLAGLFGEVASTPTTYTVLSRLKDLYDILTTRTAADRDDGSETGVKRVELIRGGLIELPFVAGTFQGNGYGGNAQPALRTTDLWQANNDGTQTSMFIQVTSNVNYGFGAAVHQEFIGDRFGFRRGVNAGSGYTEDPVSVLIDRIPYISRVQLVSDFNQGGGLTAPYGYGVPNIAEVFSDFGDGWRGRHHAEIYFPGTADHTANHGLFGIYVDANAGYRLPPVGVNNAREQITLTGGTWSTSKPASLDIARSIGIAKIIYTNNIGSTVNGTAADTSNIPLQTGATAAIKAGVMVEINGERTTVHSRSTDTILVKPALRAIPADKSPVDVVATVAWRFVGETNARWLSRLTTGNSAIYATPAGMPLTHRVDLLSDVTGVTVQFEEWNN